MQVGKNDKTKKDGSSSGSGSRRAVQPTLKKVPNPHPIHTLSLSAGRSAGTEQPRAEENNQHFESIIRNLSGDTNFDEIIKAMHSVIKKAKPKLSCVTDITGTKATFKDIILTTGGVDDYRRNFVEDLESFEPELGDMKYQGRKPKELLLKMAEIYDKYDQILFNPNTDKTSDEYRHASADFCKEFYPYLDGIMRFAGLYEQSNRILLLAEPQDEILLPFGRLLYNMTARISHDGFHQQYSQPLNNDFFNPTNLEKFLSERNDGNSQIAFIMQWAESNDPAKKKVISDLSEYKGSFEDYAKGIENPRLRNLLTNPIMPKNRTSYNPLIDVLKQSQDGGAIGNIKKLERVMGIYMGLRSYFPTKTDKYVLENFKGDEITFMIKADILLSYIEGAVENLAQLLELYQFKEYTRLPIRKKMADIVKNMEEKRKILREINDREIETRMEIETQMNNGIKQDFEDFDSSVKELIRSVMSNPLVVSLLQKMRKAEQDYINNPKPTTAQQTPEQAAFVEEDWMRSDTQTGTSKEKKTKKQPTINPKKLEALKQGAANELSKLSLNAASTSAQPTIPLEQTDTLETSLIRHQELYNTLNGLFGINPVSNTETLRSYIFAKNIKEHVVDKNSHSGTATILYNTYKNPLLNALPPIHVFKDTFHKHMIKNKHIKKGQEKRADNHLENALKTAQRVFINTDVNNPDNQKIILLSRNGDKTFVTVLAGYRENQESKGLSVVTCYQKNVNPLKDIDSVALNMKNYTIEYLAGLQDNHVVFTA